MLLDSNGLTGPLPPELGNFTALGILGLWDNDLSGSVPPELGNLPLSQLFLHDNDLTGQLPNSFLQLSLNYFRWDGNAALCMPDTAEFRAWLVGITTHGGGAFCSESGSSSRRVAELRPSGGTWNRRAGR